MNPINIMINGLPGNVAMQIARHAVENGRYRVLPFSLTGPEITAHKFEVGGFSFELLQPDKREAAIRKIVNEYENFITIDFTHPSAVNDNAAFYCRHGLPFVMGTTGGNREALAESVAASRICAVIAPNMVKQIVGLQAMLDYAAETFPGLFSGYTLTVNESHQQGKADTSGTAKAIVASFNKLGIPFSPDEIIKERDPERQKTIWGVPQEFLSGHGWHTYTLVSPDNTAKFEIKHNINGRAVYVSGTMDAVNFLNRQISDGATGKVFSMIDVLKNLKHPE